MMNGKAVLKDPLIHFIFIGIALFIVSDFISDDPQGEGITQIAVTRENLLTYMQYQAKTFDAEKVNTQLTNLPTEQRQQLIKRYIEDEVLYREAKALKLDSNDYSEKQRLIMKMKYLTRSFIEAKTAPSEVELQTYFSSHQDAYVKPAKITFTHVFFGFSQQSEAVAKASAQNTLFILNKNQVTFSEAISYGDHFLYHRNYVNREQDEIDSHFGAAMQQKLFATEASDSQWTGPFRSPYGYHLVMVTHQTPTYSPELSEVEDRVRWDVQQAHVEQAHKEAINSMVATYIVRVDKALQ